MEHAICLVKSNNSELLRLHVIEPDPAYVTYGIAPGECPDVSSFRGDTICRAKEKMDVLLG
jgi:hypothetical protein